MHGTINDARYRECQSFSASQEITSFCGIRWFITVFTKSHRFSIYRARSIHPMPPSYFLKICFNSILLSTPRSSKFTLSLIISHTSPECTSPLPHTCYMPRPSHLYGFDRPNNIWWGVPIMKLPSLFPFSLVFLRPRHLSRLYILKLPQSVFLPRCVRPNSHSYRTSQNYISVYFTKCGNMCTDMCTDTFTNM
jgi:hypothetical protein